jgi:hypothetical protein
MTTEEHRLKGRIIPVFTSGKRLVTRGDHIANHGIETCSCGYSTGEQISLPEAGRIRRIEHPEGVEGPGY